MRGTPRHHTPSRYRRLATSAVTGLVLGLLAGLASPASAHVERSSYWPDPKPDCAVSPCAGGHVPTIRSLFTSLDTAPPGVTRVVCHSDSLTRAKGAIASAQKFGYYIRPTDHRTITAARAKALVKMNTKLFAKCAYHQIQPAITASHNNDRVVVMPGLYTEPTARKKPTFDPACDKYETTSDTGDSGALSHSYQLHCPNDANLVAVIGRSAGSTPQPALENRHGIPHPGVCIRCNLQH